MFKRFYQKIAVSNLANLTDTKSTVVNRLSLALAENIVDVYCKETKEEFHRLYEMNVIVATEEDFFRAVTKVAHSTKIGYPMTLDDLDMK